MPNDYGPEFDALVAEWASRVNRWISSLFEPDPKVREALRTGRRSWPTSDGGTLTLLSSDEELMMTPEQRWTKRNAERKAQGCRCGRAATHVRYHHLNTGSVPVELWTCEEHVGVNAWVNGPNGWEPGGA